MADTQNSSNIFQAGGKISDWIFRRVRYHRSRFEAIREQEISKMYTLEQDEDTGKWYEVQSYPDYDYCQEAWYDFLEWMGKEMDPFYRITRRNSLIKEELVAKVFHPSRVERWLEAGEDVFEMMVM